MEERDKHANSIWKASTWKAFLASRGEIDGPARRLGSYLFIVSLIVIILASLALLNAYYHFVNISSYNIEPSGRSSILFASYAGMFISIALSPIPDYFLMLAYGSLSSIGIFDPYITFLVCLIAAVLPIEYLAGRLAGRPLMFKVVSYSGFSEKGIKTAEGWLEEHGGFAIFIATFVPFFYSVVALVAGTLKMNMVKFLMASTAGFGLRFATLELIGYEGIFIFTASFAYSQRYLIALILVLSSLYAVLYLIGRKRSARTDPAN